MAPLLKSFDEALTVEQLDDHHYQIIFMPQYSNGAAAHGGFISSSFLAVARLHFSTTLAQKEQPHPLLLNLQYLSPVALDKADFHVQEVKLGRLTSLIHISLQQGGKQRALAYVSQTGLDGRIDASGAPAMKLPTERHKELKTRNLPAQLARGGESGWVTCWAKEDSYSRTMTNVKFLIREEQPENMAHVEYYLLPARLGSNKFANSTLGYVADMWPQLVDAFMPGSPYSAAGMVKACKGLDEGDGMVIRAEAADKFVTHWYATQNMNVQVHRPLPEGGVDWLWCRAWSEDIGGGKMDVKVTVADAEGVVAVADLAVLLVPKAPHQQTGKGESKSKL